MSRRIRRELHGGVPGRPPAGGRAVPWEERLERFLVHVWEYDDGHHRRRLEQLAHEHHGEWVAWMIRRGARCKADRPIGRQLRKERRDEKAFLFWGPALEDWLLTERESFLRWAVCKGAVALMRVQGLEDGQLLEWLAGGTAEELEAMLTKWCPAEVAIPLTPPVPRSRARAVPDAEP